MNKRDTVSLALNVFDGFNPTLLPDQQRCDYLFLANISPELQYRVLSQVKTPKLVAADTMDFWIQNARPYLTRLLERLDILTVNDEEARMLSGEHNLVKAGRAILKMGPKSLLVKRGEYGVLQFSKEGMFAVPAYPLEEVVDPTGAGDTFAGGLMGFLARQGRLTESILAHRGRVRHGYGVVRGGKILRWIACSNSPGKKSTIAIAPSSSSPTRIRTDGTLHRDSALQRAGQSRPAPRRAEDMSSRVWTSRTKSFSSTTAASMAASMSCGASRNRTRMCA